MSAKENDPRRLMLDSLRALIEKALLRLNGERTPFIMIAGGSQYVRKGEFITNMAPEDIDKLITQFKQHRQQNKRKEYGSKH